MKKDKTAILTSFWDGPEKEFDFFPKAVRPRLEYLSKEWGAELIVEENLDEEIKRNKLNPWVQKSKNIKKYLNVFDRVLYLDSDCVVSRKTPNVFEIFPKGYLYAVLDGAKDDPNCFARCEEMIQIQAYFGSIDWTYGYYNAGVILVEKDHHYIFKDNLRCNTPYGDQGLFNYFLRKYGFPHKNLGRNYNSMSINILDPIYPPFKGLYPPEDISRGVYIAHAAGVGLIFGNVEKNNYIHKLNLLMP